MDLKKRIIQEYERVKVMEVHPTYRSIAKKLKVSHGYVHQIIQVYKAQKEAFKLK